MKIAYKQILWSICLIPIFYFFIVMVLKEAPYFTFNKYTHFLATKPDAILDHWAYLPNFFIHISTSLIVLLIGIFQFIPSFIQKYPIVHRNIGIMYIILILFFAAPSGFIIGLFANGGLSCKVGFCLQSIAWFLITFFAYIEIRRKNIENHINWMVRSFAITLAAMSLRTESYFMHYFLHTKPIETYLTVTWLSWVGNLMIAEIIIQFKIPYKILFLQIIKTLKK